MKLFIFAVFCLSGLTGCPNSGDDDDSAALAE